MMKTNLAMNLTDFPLCSFDQFLCPLLMYSELSCLIHINVSFPNLLVIFLQYCMWVFLEWAS